MGEGHKHTSGQPGQKHGASSFSPASCPEQQLACFPRARGRQEGELKGWKLFGLSEERNSHLLAFSQETAAQQLMCLLKVSL